MSLAVRSSSAAALAVVALLTGGGLARATLVSNGRVHGCVAKTGVLRVVRASAKCKRGEQSITFVARGTGPRGPAGPAGAPGKPADATAVATLQAKVATLEGEVGALQATLAGVTRSGNTLQLSGLNLQLESGAGSTDAPVNGLGNLIIGDNGSPGVQTGSNNLVIGDGQTFTSYGGLVAGTNNAIDAPSASVTGGTNNLATASFSAIAGGELNSATGNASFIGGGCQSVTGTGTAPPGTCTEGGDQAVIGGESSTASGQFSTVTGGQTDLASGNNSVAAGGEYNIASDPFSMTSAGCDNVAGTATADTQTCDSGGEGVDGGSNVSYNIKDGTGGLISDVSETSESMDVTDGAGACGNLGIGIAHGQVGDTSLFTFPTTGSLPPAALRLTPLGASTAGFSSFQVCNSSGSSITIADPVKVLTFR